MSDIYYFPDQTTDQELGFSKSKVGDFIRLATQLNKLPQR